MSHPDEGLIHAWLDGELDAAESARIEALVQSDPEWAAAVAEARGFIAATSRIISALDDVPAGVIPVATAADEPSRLGSKADVIPLPTARRGTPWWALRAAAVLVVVAGTVVVMRDGTPEVVEAVPETAKSMADLKDSVVVPQVSPLRADAPVRRSTGAEADASRQIAAEAKTKEVESAKLAGAGVAAVAPPTAPLPAAAAGAAVAATIAPSVTAGAAPAAERRALGFTTRVTGQATQPEQCFRELVVAGAREPGALHRVRVGANSVARVTDERVRARAEASASLARSASTSMNVRGDTLIIVGAEGLTVRALRVSCPSP